MKVIEPKIRGFLCTTAHPEGCRANVLEQINAVQRDLSKFVTEDGPKRVLIIGGSAGYGLSSRIVCAAGYGAKTLSISMEKTPRDNKPGSAGWYNNYYFEDSARTEALKQVMPPSYSIDGDAFSSEIKQQAADKIQAEFGQVDLVVYSLAAPRRIKQESTGESETYQSVIKPVGDAFEGVTIDTSTGQFKTVHLDPASEKEIQDTVTVMGGEDWFEWISFLNQHQLLSDHFKTVAFSYLGGDLTKAIYGDATLGVAKADVELHCRKINELLSSGVDDPIAKVAVLKAIVTQSSAAIPSLPLYISVLYKTMKAEGNHEGCLEQIIRLFSSGLYPSTKAVCKKDKPYRLRLDDEELKPDIQEKVKKLWAAVDQDNLLEVSDFEGYRSDFLQLFGFDWPGVDYKAPVACKP